MIIGGTPPEPGVESAEYDRTADASPIDSASTFLESQEQVDTSDAAPVADPSAPRMTDPDIEAYIANLSPRHHNYFHTDVATYVTLIWPQIEPVDVGRLFFKDTEYLAGLLIQHAEMTYAYQGLQLEITRLTTNSNHFSIVYRQLVDGIPVKSIGSLSFDDTGKVQRLESYIVNPDSVGPGPNIFELEAIAHARHALTTDYGTDQSGAQVLPTPRKIYEVNPPTVYWEIQGFHEPVVPYWHISMQPDGGFAPSLVMVNAWTGETKSYSFDSMN